LERAALDASSVATVWVDRQRRARVLNPAAQALLTEHPAVFRTLWPDFTPDSLEGRSLEAVVGEPLAAPRHAELVAAGSELEARSVPLHDANGEHLGWSVELRDVGARRRQDEDFARLSGAVDGLTTNLMMCDADGIIRYANAAVVEMLRARTAQLRTVFPGFDADKLIGRSIDFFHTKPAHARTVLSDRAKLPFKAQVKAAGLEFSINATGVFDAKGELIGNAVEWVDVTEQLDGQRQLAALTAQAAAGSLAGRIDTSHYGDVMRALGGGINDVLNAVQRPIFAALAALESLSAGDLTRTMQGEFQGEFGALRDAVNGTTGSLRGTIGELSEVSDAVERTTTQLAKANEDLAQRTAEQAAALEETAAALEELASTVTQTADNAQDVAELAHQTLRQAEAGAGLAGRAVLAMQKIRTSSTRIAEIIGVVDEIAFQTNLLAVNAAVEAARAGERGRGFAVVASEVRSLAGRSSAAAREIKALVRDSLDKVDQGTRLVDAAGAALRDVQGSVGKVTDVVGEIATASREQSVGVGQVNTAVSQLEAVAQQNAALVDEAAGSAEALDGEARRLVAHMHHYMLGDSRGAANRAGSDEASAPPVELSMSGVAAEPVEPLSTAPAAPGARSAAVTGGPAPSTAARR
jgi:methyl-accepting chemotaxis protein